MVSFSLLPAGLMALSWASQVLSAQLTPNDPFHAIAVRITRQPGPPMCRLTPLPKEGTEDDVLLSFEDWKAKQFTRQAQAKAKAKEKEPLNRSTHAVGVRVEGNATAALPAAVDVSSEHSGSATIAADVQDIQPSESLSPHFRVPLTDRFNYASLDCSARVHNSHRSAKSPSSILSSKRDRYMLSPCNSFTKGQQFVVVELCDDICIDTVQLANFEFFSGVFKNFKVSVAKTYTTDPNGWVVAGTYSAKNVRGVQSFHPPTSLRDFYRYIRIDFLSHYSNEYYCPISLLRVYGLTHLEQWKWDTWERESMSKRNDLEDADMLRPNALDDAAPAPTYTVGGLELGGQVVVDIAGLEDSSEHAKAGDFIDAEGKATMGTQRTASNVQVNSDNHKTRIPVSHSDGITTNSPITRSTTASSQSSDAIPPPHNLETMELPQTANVDAIDDRTPKSLQSGPSPTREDILSPSQAASATNNSLDDRPSVLDAPESQTPPSPQSSAENSGSNPHLTSASTGNSAQTASSRSSSLSPTAVISPTGTASVLIPHQLPAALPSATGGESIYRTIMNRLSALEANNTLYARYVEEQTAGTREVLKRLAEDVGRTEGIGKAQAQMLQRAIAEWEKQRRRLDREHRELMSRVDHLADEIALEKRLGIAQLLLLLAVLIFMGLTRGSRGEALVYHVPEKFNKTMREWGRRNLSFSSSWVNRFRSQSRSRSRSRSPKPKLMSPRPTIPDGGMGLDEKINFPSQEPCLLDKPPTQPKIPQIAKHPARQSVPTRSRSRTPSSVRTPLTRLNNIHLRAVTPTGPRLQRSNSGSGSALRGFGSGSTTTSARKWARSAHLHELRGVNGRPSEADGNTVRVPKWAENNAMDVFSTPSRRMNGHGLDGDRNTLYRGPLSSKMEESGEGDAWVDTDSVDGSEFDEMDSARGGVQSWPESGR